MKMTQQKSTKRALLMSALALLMCVTMLVGSTFAWFTDSVTSGNNKIVAGKLDIDLYKVELKDNWVEELRAGNDIFINEEITDSEEAIFSEDILWEPGYTEVANLKLVNNGNLALKYQAVIRPVDAVGELAEVIDVYVADQVITPMGGNREDQIKNLMTKVGTLKEVMEGTAILNGEMETAGDTHFFSIVLKMQESADNKYQEKSAGAFDISILATQYTYESDSFDDQYDKDASIADAIFAHGGIYNMEADRAEAINISAGAEVIVNGNDHAINVDGTGFQNSGNATVNDVEMNAGNAAKYSNITVGADAKTTYNNVTVNSAGGGIGAANGAEVIFNSGSVEVNTKSTSGRYLFYAEGEGTVITINGGNFADFTKTTQNQKRAYIYAGEGTTVYVNGGTFGKASTRSGYTAGILGTGNVVIKGGTFGFDPSAWVADGYTAINNNGTYYVVSENIDTVIANADQLFAFAEDVNGGNSYSGKTVALIADIDLNNVAWTPIGQTGGTEFKGVFDGQGHTIKNLNIDSSAQTGEHYSSGLFGWVEGKVTIKNVNIDGATVKGNHYVAVLLGYTYSAQISNCHVSNAKVINTHANDAACGDKAGTIAGYAGDESRFTNCSASNSTVTAGRDAGQLIGAGYNVSISGCSATAVTVTAGGDCTGNNINNAIIGRVMG